MWSIAWSLATRSPRQKCASSASTRPSRDSVLSSASVLPSRIHRALGLVAAIILLASTVPGLRLGFSPRPFALPIAAVDARVLDVLSRIAPTAHVVAAIVVDVDHDGDLDVVVRTTDETFAMWLNQGHGHFVKYSPVAATAMAAATEVDGPGGRDLTPATPARGYDAYFLAGFARPPTIAAGVAATSFVVRVDHFSQSSSGRAPPRVSLL